MKAPQDQPKITNINQFQIEALYYVDNLKENEDNPLAKVFKLICKFNGLKGDGSASFDDILYSDDMLVEWETSNDALTNVYNFYEVSRNTHPEYFL